MAAPDHKAISFNGDGAAAYTLQSLWTMAREGLDVTMVVFANHAYRILNIELSRTRSADAGPAASRLLDLGDPLTAHHFNHLDCFSALGSEIS